MRDEGVTETWMLLTDLHFTNFRIFTPGPYYHMFWLDLCCIQVPQLGTSYSHGTNAILQDLLKSLKSMRTKLKLLRVTTVTVGK